jgi:hypothetical protein
VTIIFIRAYLLIGLLSKGFVAAARLLLYLPLGGHFGNVPMEWQAQRAAFADLAQH